MTARTTTPAAAAGMALLAAGVPLTLLLDLADPWGPASAEIMAHESGRCPLPRMPAVASA